jgi:hypothetical protein
MIAQADLIQKPDPVANGRLLWRQATTGALVDKAAAGWPGAASRQSASLLTIPKVAVILIGRIAVAHSNGSERDSQGVHRGLVLARFHELGCRTGSGDQDSSSTDRVIQTERIRNSDVEHPEDAFEGIESLKVVDRLDRLLASAAPTTQTSGLGRFGDCGPVVEETEGAID